MNNSNRLLLPTDTTFVVSHKIASVLGHSDAMFLQQLHYWMTSSSKDIGKVTDGKRWIYNSILSWAEQTGFSESKVRRIIKKLESLGIILSGYLHTFKGNRTKWYTICYETLEKVLSCVKNTCKAEKKPPVQSVEMNRPSVHFEHMYNTETTSETCLNSAREEKGKEEPVVVEAVETTSPQPLVEEAISFINEINHELETPLPSNREHIEKQVKPLIGTCFNDAFHFKAYLNAVSQNKFLMGKKSMKNGQKWKLRVKWLFSIEAIEAFFNKTGFFNVWTNKQPEGKKTEMPEKLPPQDLPPLDQTEVLKTAVSEIDRKIKLYLFQKLGERLYKSWFYLTNFVAFRNENGEQSFSINTRFARDHVENRFSDDIKQAFQQA